MNFTVEQEHGHVSVTVLSPEGNVDSSTYEAFHKKANELIEAGAHYLLIDMAHVPYISSAGLRALHEIFKKLGTMHDNSAGSEAEMLKGIRDGSYKSPYLKLCNFSKNARSAFEMGGFDMYIETFNDRKSALASF